MRHQHWTLKNALSGRECLTNSAAFATRPVRSIYYSVTASQPSVSPIQGGPPSRWKALTFSQQHNQTTPTATHPRFPIGRCTQRRRADHVLLTHVYKQAHSERWTDQRMQWRERVTPMYFRFGFEFPFWGHCDKNIYILHYKYFCASCLGFLLNTRLETINTNELIFHINSV